MNEKRISILGSTGSIGTQTLDIVRKSDNLKVVALSARNNVSLLAEQIAEFEPSLVCVYEESKLKELKEILKTKNVKSMPEFVVGMEGLISVGTISCDLVVNALMGMIGIKPTIEGIKAGNDIAFANKETLVCAGHIIMPLIKEKNVKLLPVDSEHSAIFQSLQGQDKNIKKLLLTCSGGPFLNRSLEELRNVLVDEALAHPKWNMGAKITIDSATYVNKALEVIEAMWLFGVEGSQIEVLVHPQSIVHSAVMFDDNSVIAQMSLPDMRLPIQYAINYPKRESACIKELDLFEIQNLSFFKPDKNKFRALEIAYELCKTKGSMTTVFNAANELAVHYFLNNQFSFLDIYDCIEYAMNKHISIANPSLEEILEAEKEAHRNVEVWRNSR